MKKIMLFAVFVLTIIANLTMPLISYAQPYGIGLYNQITYGNQTSISITTDAIDDNIDMPTITPVAGGTIVTKDNTVTVTSTDVTGYKLYINAKDNTYMDNLGAHLPASAHTYTYPDIIGGTGLELDTWGFNTDQGTDFAGLTLAQVLIDSYSAPATAGRNTIITYGIKLDFALPAGQYVGNVVYTAVPQTD